MLQHDHDKATGPAAPAARATLIGSFRLYHPDGQEIAIPSKRARALLAILCLTDGEPVERETLARLLWPGRFPAQSKASLRQCLLDLGRQLGALGPDVLVVTRSSVAIRSGVIATDLPEAAAGERPILAEMDLGDPFAQWLAARREQLARDRAPAAPAPRAVDRHGIAILPFSSATAQGDQAYFADGMVDELITALAAVPRLQVAGRTSSFHFRDSELAPAQIAAALGVSYLVEGSVQRQGEQVRIHAHLVDGTTGFELWGSRFDGVLDDIFALQERVARAVTDALASALGMALAAPVVANLTANKEAYDLFLQGRSLCARRFGEGVLSTAVTLFEQALALDPEFAECWVALAEAHQLIAVYTQCLDRNAEAARMAECARRAIELSPGIGYAHSLLGIYELTRFNFLRALDLGFEAYRLDPHDPAVAFRLAYFLIFIGRTRDALPYIKAAVEKDPVDGRKYSLLWSVQFCMGDLEAASLAAQRMVDLGMPSIYQGLNSAALGQHDLAMEQYRLTQALVNDMILPPVGIGVQTPEAMDAYWTLAAKGICGGREEYREQYWQVLEMLFAVLHDKSDVAISGPAIMTGNADLVFRTYGLSITPSNLMALVVLWTDVDPMCRIWQHPEFIPFAQRIGMAAAWEKYGWPDLLPMPTNRV
jgi:TolB-like protein